MQTFIPKEHVTGFILPSHVFDNPAVRLSLGAKVLYGLLCNYAHDKNYCWPAQQTLAKRIGCSISAIKKYQDELIKAKLIEKKRHINSSLYYLLIPQGFEAPKLMPAMQQRQARSNSNHVTSFRHRANSSCAQPNYGYPKPNSSCPQPNSGYINNILKKQNKKTHNTVSDFRAEIMTSAEASANAGANASANTDMTAKVANNALALVGHSTDSTGASGASVVAGGDIDAMADFNSKKANPKAHQQGSSESLAHRSFATCMADFEQVWEAYPKKNSKVFALQAWKELYQQKALPPVQELLNALTYFSNSAAWQKEDGRFIPYLGKWLKGQYWLDIPSTSGAQEPCALEIQQQQHRKACAAYLAQEEQLRQEQNAKNALLKPEFELFAACFSDYVPDSPINAMLFGSWLHLHNQGKAPCPQDVLPDNKLGIKDFIKQFARMAPREKLAEGDGKVGGVGKAGNVEKETKIKSEKSKAQSAESKTVRVT